MKNKSLLRTKLCWLLVSCSLVHACSQGNMPQFDLLLSDATTVLSTSEIPSGKPIVFLYFRSDCSYCKDETEDIVENIDHLGDVRFYFVTSEDVAKAREFSNYYQLSKFQNILVGEDTSRSFEEYFKPKATPTIVIYDKNKQLRGVITGTPDIDTLIKVIREL